MYLFNCTCPRSLIHLKRVPHKLRRRQDAHDSAESQLDDRECNSPSLYCGYDIANCDVNQLCNGHCEAKFRKRADNFLRYMCTCTILGITVNDRGADEYANLRDVDHKEHPGWSSTDCTSHTRGGSSPLQLLSSGHVLGWMRQHLLSAVAQKTA